MSSSLMKSTTLPWDMLFEIFSRTSLKTLGRCRLASKDLNLISYYISFMQAFHQRTKTISGFFIQASYIRNIKCQFVSITNSPTYDSTVCLKFLPGLVKIQAITKQGILLCVNEDNPRRHRILNIISANLAPKNVRFSKPKSICTNYKSKSYNTLQCELFSSETWTWKRLTNVLLPWDEDLSWEPAVSVCGALHWLMTNNEIFAFDDTESWKILYLPSPLCQKHYYRKIKIMDYSGHLAFLYMEKSFMELWVMEDYDKNIWIKRQNISIKTIQEVEHYTSPLIFDSSDVVIMKSFDNIILYNFKSYRYNVCKTGIDFKRTDENFLFRSDLKLIHLKNFWKKQQLCRVIGCSEVNGFWQLLQALGIMHLFGSYSLTRYRFSHYLKSSSSSTDNARSPHHEGA
ncbi:F-box protein At4g19940-like [Corylus avellana]|uniref:F-box protein At4g19940-like n=1 Tax=Corylus avellana TaxID=13451 RepID=UPI00286C9978|nr:F-box protein At4g19940-like [Corylus avellana]